jgi:hypothetical protein
MDRLGVERKLEVDDMRMVEGAGAAFLLSKEGFSLRAPKMTSSGPQRTIEQRA